MASRTYGYWPDGPPDDPSLQALGAAQQAYFDHLVEHIPEGTKTILDVGSGTGANAGALVAKGFALECLCPSEQLNEMARRKLPGVRVHTTTFEAFESPNRFDLCLFAESFHYIELEAAFDQAARHATGAVLIFDYFRKPGSDYSDGTRQTHAAFLDAVAANGAFEILTDVDETEAILPTFEVADHLANTHLAPFVTRARSDLRRARPITSFVVNRLLGKTLSRLEKTSTRRRDFMATSEYRLILMARR